MRVALIAAAIGIGWYFWGAAIGLLLGLLLVLSLAMVQLHYLYRLSLWLENPDTVRLADGFGAWTRSLPGYTGCGAKTNVTEATWPNGFHVFGRR